MTRAVIARARACFLRACELDVAVRKPGNVSRASAGHRMQAEQFSASAEAAAGPLFMAGSRVGERIEAAVEATWAAVGCNTNLGILLLCAPIARATESLSESVTPVALKRALGAVLAKLDREDAQAAFRAIARANPGGLGDVVEEDVRQPPTVDLLAAMALAAPRDRIARQYRDGYAELFGMGLDALGNGFSLMVNGAVAEPDTALVAAVQRLYLSLLASSPDSHIVRNRGKAVAHNVMTAAHGWLGAVRHGAPLDADPQFAAWDASLKAAGINPGTTADLTVATLLIAGLTEAP